MSLKHVPSEDRLKVSLGYLSAVRACIARGDIPTGQPLYPDDAIEFLDEILKAKDIMEQQAAYIKTLEQQNKELNAKINRDDFQTRLRESVPTRTVSVGRDADTVDDGVSLQTPDRLSQLSATMTKNTTNTGEQDYGPTNEAGFHKGTASSRQPSYEQKVSSISSKRRRRTTGSLTQSLTGATPGDAIPEPDWDNF